MTPCNHWVNCSIFALLTRAMNMYLTFRRKVSRFWGIRTFTNTALSHTRVSLKPATLFNVEKDLGKKLVPVLLYALRKCNSFPPFSCLRFSSNFVWAGKMASEALASSSSCSELEAGNDSLDMWKTKDVKCEFLLEARMSNTSHYSVAE